MKKGAATGGFSRHRPIALAGGRPIGLPAAGATLRDRGIPRTVAPQQSRTPLRPTGRISDTNGQLCKPSKAISGRSITPSSYFRKATFACKVILGLSFHL
jgi:hypothetical protein